jgi:hypothetical protein
MSSVRAIHVPLFAAGNSCIVAPGVGELAQQPYSRMQWYGVKDAQ